MKVLAGKVIAKVVSPNRKVIATGKVIHAGKVLA